MALNQESHCVRLFVEILMFMRDIVKESEEVQSSTGLPLMLDVQWGLREYNNPILISNHGFIFVIDDWLVGAN